MKYLFIVILAFLFFQINVGQVVASFNPKAGIHILHTREISAAALLLNSLPTENWHYVTIPLTLDDLKHEAEWQVFLNQAHDYRIIPIVRLVSRFDGKNWAVPSRKDIVDQINFLAKLNWPQEERLLVVFNEPNHKAEFGGEVDPAEYARILRFTSDWARTENKGFKILPAGLDLAAPNGPQTMDAFTFIGQMLKADPSIFDTIDHWNSHSYPNPGFMSSPTRSARNTMRGFIYELDFIKQQTGKDFDVYITETGWLNNSLTARSLDYYYAYTAANIWSDPRVKAVTPFILQGDPGPFAGFSFLDRNGNTTKHYEAYQKIIVSP